MLVTKLEHACLVVEEDGARLVIDPGAFTRPVEVTGVVAVVVTHEHPDHGTAEQVAGILERNPGIPVFGPAGVATALAEVVAVDVVTAGGGPDRRAVLPHLPRDATPAHPLVRPGGRQHRGVRQRAAVPPRRRLHRPGRAGGALRDARRRTVAQDR
ncbi:MBL fold metallo-hydrolase [Curtobacterium sp. MCJR17_043]|uniref:MBL fold metallo-hydrolase n=1 Tax=Curtobacterium sp. MCJR17_043 TaxID=2175660 RepID=UPI0024DFC97F|nr:MBL fold metallo-hydrolase [Curtobacterium sp. MCJR17_043]WIB35217.1 MBL fold metallo-hydrolase [Curtobacterium sp. MCJR17_043]